MIFIGSACEPVLLLHVALARPTAGLVPRLFVVASEVKSGNCN